MIYHGVHFKYIVVCLAPSWHRQIVYFAALSYNFVSTVKKSCNWTDNRLELLDGSLLWKFFLMFYLSFVLFAHSKQEHLFIRWLCHLFGNTFLGQPNTEMPFAPCSILNISGFIDNKSIIVWVVYRKVPMQLVCIFLVNLTSTTGHSDYFFPLWNLS